MDCNVGSGSTSDSTKRNLTAAQLTLAPRRQTADCRGWLWTATCGHPDNQKDAATMTGFRAQPT